MKNRKLPSSKILNQLFDYDKKTGILYWSPRPLKLFLCASAYKGWNTKYANTAAGSLRKDGHLQVAINGKLFYLHRIVWKLVTNEDPGELEIDHKNNCKSDNRWRNLRKCNNSEQSCNTKVSVTSVSGIKGVRWSEKYQYWITSVTLHGREHNAGYFNDLEAAIRATKKLRRKLHKEFVNHG